MRLKGRIISMPQSKRLAPCLESWQAVLDEVDVFPAVIGSQIACTDSRLSVDLYKRLQEGFQIFGSNTDYMTNKAQIGCALSHIALWQECAQRKEPLLVIEDDTVVKSSRAEIERHLANQSFVSLIYLYLSRTSFSGKISDISTSFYGFQAYYITPSAANVLLRDVFPLSLHIDRYAAYVAKRSEMSWICAHPRLQYDMSGSSTLSHEQVPRAKIFGSVFVGLLVVMSLVIYIVLHRHVPKCRK